MKSGYYMLRMSGVGESVGPSLIPKVHWLLCESLNNYLMCICLHLSVCSLIFEVSWLITESRKNFCLPWWAVMSKLISLSAFIHPNLLFLIQIFLSLLFTQLTKSILVRCGCCMKAFFFFFTVPCSTNSSVIPT